MEQRIEPTISDFNQTKEKHLGIDNFIAVGRQEEKNVLPGVIDPKNLVLDDSRKQEIIRKNTQILLSILSYFVKKFAFDLQKKVKKSAYIFIYISNWHHIWKIGWWEDFNIGWWNSPMNLRISSFYIANMYIQKNFLIDKKVVVGQQNDISFIITL